MANVYQDSRLSFKARGIYAYLCSLSSLENISEKRLVSATPKGLTAVRSGVVELERYGYLKRFKRRNGLVVWRLPKLENRKLVSSKGSERSDDDMILSKLLGLGVRLNRVIDTKVNNLITKYGFEKVNSAVDSVALRGSVPPRYVIQDSIEVLQGKSRHHQSLKIKHSLKNHVYHNWGRVERTAQGVAMFRSGGFALTPIIDEDRKVAKFMIDHGMYTHDKNNIKKAQKYVRSKK